MCESTVYTAENEIIMEDVMVVEINGNKIEMVDILNNKKIVHGKFTKLDLEGHKLYVELD
ncbi:CooT family nickel-binding protein [Methanobrevibacter filiformis]|uniref:Putative RNA-binding protein n=1 Tax=Methanobrevibacter filiformis TaxID=55758 RepID=A0A166F1G3_9EURY|nr:CooT family nickel-binding protein [Methanobrevibacter filiformis]KZX17222.1 putative RNA-binding protein [Methanobrevibacter filiformis]